MQPVPSSDENLATSHFAQPLPNADHEPSGQRTHNGGEVCRVNANPALHGVQNEAFSSEYPFSHALHSVWPRLAEYSPALHATQLSADFAPETLLEVPGGHALHMS